jgi:hypothetical protein
VRALDAPLRFPEKLFGDGRSDPGVHFKIVRHELVIVRNVKVRSSVNLHPASQPEMGCDRASAAVHGDLREMVRVVARSFRAGLQLNAVEWF